MTMEAFLSEVAYWASFVAGTLLSLIVGLTILAVVAAGVSAIAAVRRGDDRRDPDPVENIDMDSWR
jgi:hypothetical protein